MSKLNVADALAVLQAVAPSLAAGNVFALHCFDDPFVDALIDEMGLPTLATELQSGQVLSGPLSPDQAAVVEHVQSLTDTIALVGFASEYNNGSEAAVAGAAQGYNADCAYGEQGCDCATHIDAQLMEDELLAFAAAPVEPERHDILIDAAVTITHERNGQYGEPENSFPKIAALWNAYLNVGADLIEPKDVAMMMVLLKIARDEGGYKRDTFVDAAGYAAIAGELALAQETAPGTIH